MALLGAAVPAALWWRRAPRRIPAPGASVLAFSREDPGAAARVVKGFAKEHEKLVTVALRSE